ncbi:regulator of chromosome condensation domain protein [Ichthyophthirius multifiliis]|uniref:Regulator of chromosome condensation domain protein n=1 Tax=Ichthyophthirius multifiliis TaxID=5932 RepID=G0QMN2_ICHMU|nr:regulator of chromosome condensation domain protein [Ichthyophthirius multifiliis]EGR33524.1 regulator of chromosome condensation domain protein [Ichthyophthirius multifiliis]|eukprot:XP_004037510.1 regulator of chromosome condensation domain protein [Ichthyophthirius multifiliis]
MNSQLIQKKNCNKIQFGGGFILLQTSDGQVYGLGENYKGQLGIGDLGFKHQFSRIVFDTQEQIIDISAGYQHSIFLTQSGFLYGTGRSNWHQIVPYLNDNQQSREYNDYYTNPKRMVIPNEKVVKLSAGFSHTIFLTVSGKLFALGLNNHGQCGTSNLNNTTIDQFNEIYVDLDYNEKIIDLAAGKSHNIFITNQCSPKQVFIEMENGEFPLKVKAKFDRNAVFTNFGNCYVWGGEDLSKIGAENYSEIKNIRKDLQRDLKTNEDFQIKDIGLGYLHTLVLV